MINIKGKNYIQVVAVHTIDGFIGSGREFIMKAINENNILKFLDKQHMQFMAAADLGPQWVALGKAEIVLLIADDYSDAISPADLHKLYMIDKRPVTPKELIEEAIKVSSDLSNAEIQDTMVAAAILRALGHKIEHNPNPTPKYWDYKTGKKELLLEKINKI